MKKSSVEKENVLLLLKAIVDEDESKVKEQLNSGTDVNDTVRDEGFFNTTVYGPALELAFFREWYSIVPTLLSYGADPRTLPKEAILKLVENEDNELLSLLLKSGLPYSKKNDPENWQEDDYDLLLSALSKDNLKLVNILINNGIDFSFYDNGKYSPLIARQVVLASAEKTKLILDYSKYDINKPVNDSKRTLLHQAAKDRYSDTVLLLLQSGANPDPVDEEGVTPLWFSITHKDISSAKALLEAGANPNRTQWDRTFLGVAVNNLDYQMVQLLLEYGADANAVQQNGKKPIEMLPNYKEIMLFLTLQKHSN
ncbi:ankyrin repeat domain-containing protein [Paenibacillus sp. O199]|uniref:ankyrin repeat domain-containing protein n=1 Tax=Paenibacillus sp. O199 TaxID=1643925 RepID=UPI0007BF0BF7|nr:ankyrin repeat domain-containing protein [Paenibacillus sp. O199]